MDTSYSAAMKTRLIERRPTVATPRKTPITAMSVPVPVRDAVNREALQFSAELGRRISMAAMISAALDVARRHPEELAAALAAPTTEGTDD